MVTRIVARCRCLHCYSDHVEHDYNTTELHWEECPRESGHSGRVRIAAACSVLESETDKQQTNERIKQTQTLVSLLQLTSETLATVSFAQETDLERLNCCSKSWNFSFCFYALQTSFQAAQRLSTLTLLSVMGGATA